MCKNKGIETDIGRPVKIVFLISTQRKRWEAFNESSSHTQQAGTLKWSFVSGNTR
jgi:hypothetical protein